jgi:hypothetical protein
MRADLWTCPHCARQFANQNQEHSCVVRTVEDFLAGRPEHAVQLFEAFKAAALSCGDVTLAPVQTRIGFQARMIFASVNKITENWLDAHVVLARRLEHPRFRKVETISTRNHVHSFRISNVSDVDEDVMEWLQEAYRVGEQEHHVHRRSGDGR